MNKHFVNLVKITVSLEHLEPLIKVLEEDGKGSLENESGTIRFDIIKDNNTPNILYLYEVYADEAAFKAHKEGHYFNLFKEFVKKFCDAHGNGKGLMIIEELCKGSPLFPPFEDSAWQRTGRRTGSQLHQSQELM